MWLWKKVQWAVVRPQNFFRLKEAWRSAQGLFSMPASWGLYERHLFTEVSFLSGLNGAIDKCLTTLEYEPLLSDNPSDEALSSARLREEVFWMKRISDGLSVPEYTGNWGGRDIGHKGAKGSGLLRKYVKDNEQNNILPPLWCYFPPFLTFFSRKRGRSPRVLWFPFRIDNSMTRMLLHIKSHLLGLWIRSASTKFDWGGIGNWSNMLEWSRAISIIFSTVWWWIALVSVGSPERKIGFVVWM